MTAAPSRPSSLGEILAPVVAKLGELPAEPVQQKPPETIPPKKEEARKEEPPKKEEQVQVPKKEDAPAVIDENLNPNLAPKKPEEPPKTPVEDGPPEKGMTKEARDWAARTRKEAESAKKIADERTAEVADLKAKLDAAASSAPEITRLKAELEEAQKIIKANSDEIAIARIESTPQYKEAVQAPMQEVEATIGKLAEAYGLRPSAILDAIKEPDFTKRAEAIEEVTTGMKGMERDAVIDAAKTYQRAQKIAEDLRGNAKQKLEEMAVRSKQEQDGAVSAAAEEYRKSFDQEWKAIQEKHPLLRPVEGQDKWNEYLARIQRDGLAVDVNNVTGTDVARGVAAERALPELARVVEHFQKTNADLTERLEKAEARIAEYVETTPGAGAGRNGNGPAAPVVDQNASPGQAIMARVKTA